MISSIAIIISVGLIVSLISLVLLKSRECLNRYEFDEKHKDFYSSNNLYNHQSCLLIKYNLYAMYKHSYDIFSEKNYDINEAYKTLMQNEDFLEKLSFYQNPIQTHIS